MERGALDILNQPPAAACVGENRDREVLLGNQLEQQDVAGKGAAMRRGARIAHGPQLPADPHLVVIGVLAQAAAFASVERRPRQHARPARTRPVAKMEARVRQQVVHRHRDAAGRERRSERERAHDRRRAVRADAVAEREAVRDDVADAREGA